MRETTLTVDELGQLRARRDRLTAAAAAVRGTGHEVPAELVEELREIPTVVDVAIRCLLCAGLASYPAEVASDATPHAAICARCDGRCSPERSARS